MKKYLSIFVLLLIFLFNPSLSSAQLLPCIPQPAAGTTGTECKPSTGNVQVGGGGTCTLVGDQFLCMPGSPSGSVSAGGAAAAPATIKSFSCPKLIQDNTGSFVLPAGYVSSSTAGIADQCVCSPNYTLNAAGQCVGIVLNPYRDVTLKLLEIKDGTSASIEIDGGVKTNYIVNRGSVTLKLSEQEHTVKVTIAGRTPATFAVPAVKPGTTPVAAITPILKPAVEKPAQEELSALQGEAPKGLELAVPEAPPPPTPAPKKTPSFFGKIFNFFKNIFSKKASLLPPPAVKADLRVTDGA